jgi:hypothetical protein
MIEGDKGTARFGDDFEVLDREGCPMAGGESVRARKVFPCPALTLVGAPLALVGSTVGMRVKTSKYDTETKRATSHRQRARTSRGWTLYGWEWKILNEQADEPTKKALAQASVTLAAPIRRATRLITRAKKCFMNRHNSLHFQFLARPFLRSFISSRFAKRAPESTRRASQTSGTRSQGPRSGPSHALSAAHTPLNCLAGCLASDQAYFPAPISPVPWLFSLVPQASTPIRRVPHSPHARSHPLKSYTVCCIHELPARPIPSHYVRRHGGSDWTTVLSL